MGWRFNRRIKDDAGSWNISKSGVSRSAKWTEGFSTNFSKRGRRHTLNFGHGLTYQWLVPNLNPVLPRT